MAIDAVGQFFGTYHSQFSQSFRFIALGRTASELSRSAIHSAHLFDVDNSIEENVRYAGTLLNSALSSRVYALGLLMLETLDIVTLKAAIRPLRALQILDDSGITCESVARTLVAASLAVTTSVLKTTVAALSIILPEVTLGMLDLDTHLARMHFWWVACRLNADAILYGREPYNAMSSFEFRRNFVERCMLDYALHAPSLPLGHFFGLYEQMLNPVGIPALLTQINLSSGGQHGIFHERGTVPEWIVNLPFVPQTDTALEQSPFSVQFAQYLVTCGNYLIQNHGYSKENIRTFMGNDYIGVMNNALFATIHTLFRVQDNILKIAATDSPLQIDDVGARVYHYADKYKKVLEKVEMLSEVGKEALQWHLCCDDQRMHGHLLTEESLDLLLIKEIVPLITELRIGLVEQGIATQATSVLRDAFERLGTNLV